jgi:hypothetical protein
VSPYSVGSYNYIDINRSITWHNPYHRKHIHIPLEIATYDTSGMGLTRLLPNISWNNLGLSPNDTFAVVLPSRELRDGTETTLD